jgi:hypothetical protein
VFVGGASLHFWRFSFEAILEPWRNFEELWRSFAILEPIWSFEVHKCLIGALWRYLEALHLHVCIFQHCKSSFE